MRYRKPPTHQQGRASRHSFSIVTGAFVVSVMIIFSYAFFSKTGMASSQAEAQVQPLANSLVFDVTQTAHRFDGFGAMVWQSADSFKWREELQALYSDSLNLRWARINHETRPNLPACNFSMPIGGDFPAYDEYWEACGDGKTPLERSDNGVDIHYILHGKVPPEFREEYEPGKHRFLAVYANDYALYLTGAVKNFGEVNGKLPAYVEISNEPDGYWTVRIEPQIYNQIAKKLRAELDAQALSEVGIVGPGLAHLDNWKGGDDWMMAMEPETIAGMGAWSVHAWIWATTGWIIKEPVVNQEGGQTAIRDYWPDWYEGVEKTNPDLPIIVTEFSATADTYHGTKYPAPNTQDPTAAPNTVPYGVRAYYNAISLLSSGVNVPVYWEALDQSWEVRGYGLIDLDGEFTNMHMALEPLLTLLPLEAQSLTSPPNNDENGTDIYGVGFVKDNCTIIALANATNKNLQKRVVLTGVEAVGVQSVTARIYKQADKDDVYSGVVEDYDVDVQYDSDMVGYYFDTGEMPQDSHLTVRVCFE